MHLLLDPLPAARDRPGLSLSRLVIGIGNPDRGDDAAGRLVARRLRGRLAEDVAILELRGEATELLAALEGPTSVVLVDACVSGVPPGTVRRFDAGAGPLPAGAFGLSSHGLGPAEAIELARALGQLPPRCLVYAIEGASFEIGAPLSDRVAAALAAVADRIAADLSS